MLAVVLSAKVMNAKYGVPWSENTTFMPTPVTPTLVPTVVDVNVSSNDPLHPAH